MELFSIQNEELEDLTLNLSNIFDHNSSFHLAEILYDKNNLLLSDLKTLNQASDEGLVSLAKNCFFENQELIKLLRDFLGKKEEGSREDERWKRKKEERGKIGEEWIEENGAKKREEGEKEGESQEEEDKMNEEERGRGSRGEEKEGERKGQREGEIMKKDGGRREKMKSLSAYLFDEKQGEGIMEKTKSDFLMIQNEMDNLKLELSSISSLHSEIFSRPDERYSNLNFGLTSEKKRSTLLEENNNINVDTLEITEKANKSKNNQKNEFNSNEDIIPSQTSLLKKEEEIKGPYFSQKNHGSSKKEANSAVEEKKVSYFSQKKECNSNINAKNLNQTHSSFQNEAIKKEDRNIRSSNIIELNNKSFNYPDKQHEKIRITQISGQPSEDNSISHDYQEKAFIESLCENDEKSDFNPKNQEKTNLANDSKLYNSYSSFQYTYERKMSENSNNRKHHPENAVKIDDSTKIECSDHPNNFSQIKINDSKKIENQTNCDSPLNQFSELKISENDGLNFLEKNNNFVSSSKIHNDKGICPKNVATKMYEKINFEENFLEKTIRKMNKDLKDMSFEKSTNLSENEGMHAICNKIINDLKKELVEAHKCIFDCEKKKEGSYNKKK